MIVDVQYLREYCLQKQWVEESFPFGGDTLVFKVMDKIFALVGLDNFPPRVNLKCDPDKVSELRSQYPEAIIPGYHMNKKHWNTVFIESGLDDPFICQMIDDSYDLVYKGVSNKIKSEWNKL